MYDLTEWKEEGIVSLMLKIFNVMFSLEQTINQVSPSHRKYGFSLFLSKVFDLHVNIMHFYFPSLSSFLPSLPLSPSPLSLSQSLTV